MILYRVYYSDGIMVLKSFRNEHFFNEYLKSNIEKIAGYKKLERNNRGLE